MNYIKSIRSTLGSRKIILNCAGAVIVSDGKILCQRRSDNNKWGLVGGLMELNETYEEAALREIKEETGLDVRLTAFLGIFHNHNMVWSNGDRAHTVGAYFLADIVSGELSPDNESYELRFFAADELPDLFAEDHRAAVSAYLSGVRLPLLNENKHSTDALQFITLRERPELEDASAEWFHMKWGVPKEAYLECMNDYLSGKTEYGWYLCLDGEELVGGLGVIENDFHDRKDLAPNVCAVYTDESHRSRGIAGKLLNMAVEDLRSKGVSPVYLVTDHTGFYERYGWEFLCMVQGDGEPDMTRMYIHR